MIVVPTASRIDQLDAIKAAQLDGGSVRLFQNDLTPNKNTLLAAFVPASFPGYVAKVVVAFGAVFLDPNGIATALSPLLTWTPTGDDPSNQIYGLYFTDVGGALVFSYRFETPKSVASVNDVINLVVKYQSGKLEAAA
jgi:hypothetical protein